MFAKSKLVWVGVGVLVFALLAAGIGGTIVLAQGPTTTPAAPPAATTPSTGSSSSSSSTQSTQQTLSDLFWQSFAQKLGTTADKAKQAANDAEKDALTQAVQKGLLTQNQADAMLQRLQNGGAGKLFGLPGARGTQNNVRATIENAGLDAAAKTLGMSTADLTTALRNGQTLLALAQSKNVDVTKLRTAISDAEKAAVDQAVKNGQLTQAQGDALKANLAPNNIDLNRGFFFSNGIGRGMGPGMRPGMGPGGMMPFGGMGPQGRGRGSYR